MAIADNTAELEQSANEENTHGNMSNDEFVDKIITKMEDEGALLTCDEMDMIEQFWEEDRRTRRCALIQLTKSFKWLSDNVENDDEFAGVVAELYECFDPKKYEAIAKILNCAHLRLMVSLAGRGDMQSLLNKAKAI